MSRVVSASVGILAVAGFLLVVGMGSSAKEKKAAEPYQLIVPLEVIMEVQDEMFYDLEDVLEKKKFKTLKNHALFLMEMANVTSHAVKKDSMRSGWKRYCDRQKENFKRMAVAAKAKKEKEVKALFGAAEETCEGCHDDYQDDFGEDEE